MLPLIRKGWVLNSLLGWIYMAITFSTGEKWRQKEALSFSQHFASQRLGKWSSWSTYCPVRKAKAAGWATRATLPFPWLHGSPPSAPPLPPACALSGQQAKERKIEHHVLKWGQVPRWEGGSHCHPVASTLLSPWQPWSWWSGWLLFPYRVLHSYWNSSTHHNLAFLIFCLCRLIAYLSRLRKAIYPRCGFKMCTLDVGLSGSDREVSREIVKIFWTYLVSTTMPFSSFTMLSTSTLSFFLGNWPKALLTCFISSRISS